MTPISSIAASGMRVAVMGVRASAHNVAVQPVDPVGPRQVLAVHAVATGGVQAQVVNGEGPPDMVADLLAAKTYEVAFAANAVVIRRESQMLGSLFDAFA
ncbi:MAG: hypothetical protein WA956_13445 [Stenotrophomonas sp.]